MVPFFLYFIHYVGQMLISGSLPRFIREIGWDKGRHTHTIQCKVCTSLWVNQQWEERIGHLTLFVMASLKQRQHLGKIRARRSIKVELTLLP